jgi:hypothetical protein
MPPSVDSSLKWGLCINDTIIYERTGVTRKKTSHQNGNFIPWNALEGYGRRPVIELDPGIGPDVDKRRMVHFSWTPNRQGVPGDRFKCKESTHTLLFNRRRL